MKKLLIAALMLSTCGGHPAFADEVQQETLTDRGNLFNLKKTDEGYILEVVNGWTPGSVVAPADYEVTLDGFTVRFSYTYVQNYYNEDRNQPKPKEEAADMVDILEVPDGWIAWPAYQSIPEDGRGEIKIIPNLMG